jgi:hypothetical protein
MARNIAVGLDESTSYRGVVLFLYPGFSHGFELKEYTSVNGMKFSYHHASAYGPYSTRGPATSQVTSELKQHARKVEATGNPNQRGWYGNYDRNGIPEVTAFVEEQVPQWKTIPETIRQP